MSACMGATTSSLDTQKETRSDSRMSVITGSCHRDPGLKARVAHLKKIAKDMAWPDIPTDNKDRVPITPC